MVDEPVWSADHEKSVLSRSREAVAKHIEVDPPLRVMGWPIRRSGGQGVVEMEASSRLLLDDIQLFTAD